MSLEIIAPTVSSLTSQVIDNNVLLYLTGAPGTLPIDKFRISRGDVFAAATVLGEIGGTFHMLMENQSGIFTYWAEAKDSAGKLPVVAVAIDDPIDMRLAASRTRPGGHITGTVGAFEGIVPRRLQLLKDFVPDAKRVAILMNPLTLSRPSLDRVPCPWEPAVLGRFRHAVLGRSEGHPSPSSRPRRVRSRRTGRSGAFSRMVPEPFKHLHVPFAMVPRARGRRASRCAVARSGHGETARWA